ncbi:MAG: 6,7-dimethyl-8-ribityllumazine synthase [Phycisphaerales bacterium]
MPKGPANPEMTTTAAELRCAVVVSRYNAWITDRLLLGAHQEWERAGGATDALEVISAPGSFELPVLARAAATCGRFHAVVALGCLIRGETTHDQHIARSVADGLQRIAIDTGVPVAFGVLTVENEAQAEARAGGDQGNKGAESMRAALETLAALDAIHRKTPLVGQSTR